MKKDPSTLITSLGLNMLSLDRPTGLRPFSTTSLQNRTGADPICDISATIAEIWRYPVSSLGGERIECAHILRSGVEGDRAFLLTDAVSGETASPETSPRWRRALFMTARYEEGRLLVTVPEAGSLETGSSLDGAISTFMGFPCSVVRLGARAAGCKTALPRYDAAPLHLITTRTLQSISDALSEIAIDARRFRPNIVLASDHEENGWCGRDWTAAAAGGVFTEATKRCGMTMIAQPGLSEQPEILRTIVRHHRRNLGVYTSVTTEGVISVGDSFELA